jgi:hypothetical protein
MENLHTLLQSAKTLISENKTLEALDSLIKGLDINVNLKHIDYLAIQRARLVRIEEDMLLFGSNLRHEVSKVNQATQYLILEIANDNKIKLQATDSDKANVKSTNDEAFKSLGRELALNYFTVSFSDRYQFHDQQLNEDIVDDITRKVLEEDLANFFIHERERGLCRNIFVIGAGATFNNFKEFPYGDNMHKILKKELNVNAYLNSVEEFKDGIRKEFEEAETLDFEKYISFLARTFGKDKVTEKLKKFYNVKHLPCLAYEIIAHLLKHGFIDVVINFNFDELLDQAIEEEVGQGNYYKIVSDGDVIPLSDIVVNGSIKIPVYIKAHGTASNKSTLNLTQNSYFEIPSEVSALIEQLVWGKRENKLEKIPIVNVTCIGYSMQSKQFNSILAKHLDTNSQIFNFNVNTEPSSRIDKIDKMHKGFVNLSYIAPQNGLSSFDIAMKSLWKKIDECFKKEFKPRQTSRHEIIANIFYEYNVVGNENHTRERGKTNIHDNLKEYFKFAYYLDRVIIEIGVLIAKNKGILDFHEVMPERIGNYYLAYRKKNEPRESRGDFTTLYSIAKTVFKMVPRYDFSGNLLIFPPVEEHELPKGSPEWLKIMTEDCESEESLINKINKTKGSQILFRYFNNGHLIKEGDIINRILKGLKSTDIERRNTVIFKIKSTLSRLNDLVEDFVYDINPKFEDRKLFRFGSFTKNRILHTNLALNYEIFSKFLQPVHEENSTDWEVLLMVSERGKTIKKALDKMSLTQLAALKEKKIIMICAYEVAHEEVLNAGISNVMKVKDLEKVYKGTFINNEKIKNKDPKEIAIKNIIDGIKILFIPYREHSNHMTLFMSTHGSKFIDDKSIINVKIDSEKEHEKPVYVGIDSVYYYKKGISNKINPITISKATEYVPKSHKLAIDDNRYLLKIFYKYYLIGRVFEETNNMVGYISETSSFTIGKSANNEPLRFYDFVKILKSGKMSDLDGDFTLNG